MINDHQLELGKILTQFLLISSLQSFRDFHETLYDRAIDSITDFKSPFYDIFNLGLLLQMFYVLCRFLLSLLQIVQRPEIL